MKFKAALFYKDSLVYYSIYYLGNDLFKAKLDSCAQKSSPPYLLELRKQGSKWCPDCPESELVSELGAAINQRLLRRS